MEPRTTRALVVGLVALAAIGAAWFLWPRSPIEVAVRPIPLAGGADVPEAELSGLAWHGDTLVLLPQYPARFLTADGRPSLLTLRRADLEAFLDGTRESPLTPGRVPFEAPELEAEIPGFDGFESIVFAGDRVFVTVESRRDGDTVGWLAAGRVEGALARIVLEPRGRVRLRAQNELENIGYETITLHRDQVIVLYETNGEVNPRPTAYAFDHALRPLPALRVAPLEYRVTDATRADARGRFWVVNYHWPGSPWSSGECALTDAYGQGESHARCQTVERLVELQIAQGRITPTSRPPVLLELEDVTRPRNWEGLVRLGDRGFLIVTDMHPETMLAFVPFDDP